MDCEEEIKDVGSLPRPTCFVPGSLTALLAYAAVTGCCVEACVLIEYNTSICVIVFSAGELAAIYI